MILCDTERRPRGDHQDLWCTTHDAWVYDAATTERLNENHEKARWGE